MATPEEVYNSDTYKSVAEGRQGKRVPLAWFQDVYEALGKALSAQQSVQTDKCPSCSGVGWLGGGLIQWRCPRCQGAGIRR